MWNTLGKFYKYIKKDFSTREKVDKALNERNLKKCIVKLQGFQSSKHFVKLNLPERKQAAVLISLCSVNQELCLLYTLRTMKLKRHSGQVSFPGGMLDENETTEDAALRETKEELGINPERVTIWGTGALFPGMNVAITPVLGYIKEFNINDLHVNEDEVRDVFTLPIHKFCIPENCKHTQFRNDYSTPVFLVDNRKIWGITAFITHTFLRCFLPGVYTHKIPYIKPLYK